MTQEEWIRQFWYQDSKDGGQPLKPYEYDALRVKREPSDLERTLNTLNIYAKYKQADREKEKEIEINEALKDLKDYHRNNLMQMMLDKWYDSWRWW